jgi:mannose/fructose-specific phosphotransferase system component IIA
MSEAGHRGVVVAHGQLAAGLLSAVRRIAGVDEGVLFGLSNDGLGPDAVLTRLDELLEGGPGFIFSDLREGSCGLIARKACQVRTDRVLVTGANLPMLLDFVMQRHLPEEQLIRRLVERGRGSVTTFPEVS